MRKETNLILCLMISVSGYSQARIVLGGTSGSPYMNITGGACLVIDNPATNAITRNSGHVISEGENNAIRWNIGNSTGAFTVPWGYGTSSYIPLQFTISSAGTSGGYFKFSTYRTGSWQNSSYLPSGITNANTSAGGTDGSAYMADRFWSVDASSYSTKPSLSNLVFTYADDGSAWEIYSANSITENNLQAQRWNSTLNDWESNWISGTADATSNSVTVSTLASTDLFTWWTLIDPSPAGPLPIELLSFSADCQNLSAHLSWSTATELNSAYFEIGKTEDMVNFQTVATVSAAGNSSVVRNYVAEDPGQVNNCYYRLKEVDQDGSFKFYPLIFYNACNAKPDDAQLWSFGNVVYGRVNGMKNKVSALKLYDLQGKLLMENEIKAEDDMFFFSVDTHFPAGHYVVVLTNEQNVCTAKLFIQ
jgi:hypothetical protein